MSADYVACPVCGLAFKAKGLAIHTSVHYGHRNGSSLRRLAYVAEASRVAQLAEQGLVPARLLAALAARPPRLPGCAGVEGRSEAVGDSSLVPADSRDRDTASCGATEGQDGRRPPTRVAVACRSVLAGRPGQRRCDPVESCV